MRPRSDIRQALLAAVDQQHAATQSGATWREVMYSVPGVDPRSPAEVALVRRTWENARAAGDLLPVAQRTATGRGRPMVACRVRPTALQAEAANDATTELAALMAAWCA